MTNTTEKRPRGRPPLAPEDRRSREILVRVTPPIYSAWSALPQAVRAKRLAGLREQVERDLQPTTTKEPQQ